MSEPRDPRIARVDIPTPTAAEVAATRDAEKAERDASNAARVEAARAKAAAEKAAKLVQTQANFGTAERESLERAAEGPLRFVKQFLGGLRR